MARLVTGGAVGLPVLVLHGKTDGPVVWLTGAIHGDEIGGVEIIRRLLGTIEARSISGTVLAVPIVNVHGFLAGERHLPDRRDLNKCFPGRAKGSFGSRSAKLLMSEIIERGDIGIDLHTGSNHRTNLPHVRADLDDGETRALAEAFAPPLMVHSRTSDGSLRQAATEHGVKVLVYEGGEAWRYRDDAVQAGVDGVLRVLHTAGVVAEAPEAAGHVATVPRESRKSHWVRARKSGIVHLDVELGERVTKGQVIGEITDTFGKRLSRFAANSGGMVIGYQQYPLVNRGDQVVHIAEILGDDG